MSQPSPPTPAGHVSCPDRRTRRHTSFCESTSGREGVQRVSANEQKDFRPSWGPEGTGLRQARSEAAADRTQVLGLSDAGREQMRFCWDSAPPPPGGSQGARHQGQGLSAPGVGTRVVNPSSRCEGRAEVVEETREVRRSGGATVALLRTGAGDLDGPRVVKLSKIVSSQPKVLTPCRSDVLVLTPWLAPIVWEGTFNIDILNAHFQLQNITIGLTVFAIKKYMVFLKLFLETAEKYFMVGHRVNYYVFTDRPADVPHVPLKEGRQVVVLQVRNYTRWQDVSMHRMEMISNFSEQRFMHEVDYLVCADVDMQFSDHVGVEILSSLFGTLHPGFYAADRKAFTYERRPQSQAHIPWGEGDFYYMGAFFGGSVLEVQRLTKACHQAMMVDHTNHIEAVWHDESHLNKYLLYHKPTKVLSPEYLWDEQLLGRPPIMKKLRFVSVPKNHQIIRN
ncbi:histo-blood group ABO system transferase [Orycteropus afer afer]|uniref:Histo-blood group ABO system transferase n=1 Tax=Orycteropus afer afer TaxID=1230840 RepID=A0A8B7AY40_ORYAF|nr:histo-blood group ABO system transferase [Orycteropus afer afer]